MSETEISKPVVMVSSIVEGFTSFRAAARRAIEDAGGQPLLVNEDYPSRAASSRNVCLDAVEAADVYAMVLGGRGGWTTPSGMLVVEEEYNEAVRLRRPILIFVQEVKRDAEATRLLARVSDYVSGKFRTTFIDESDLKAKMRAALTAEFRRISSPKMPADPVTQCLRAKPVLRGVTSVRTVLSPVRFGEVISPADLESANLKRKVLELAHSSAADLFSFENASETTVRGDALVLRQNGPQAPVCEVNLNESGLIVIEHAAQPFSPNIDTFMASMVLAEGDIETRLGQALRFAGAVFEHLDPYCRHQQFWFNCALLELGYKTIERNPQPRTSYPMSMYNPSLISAYDSPREIGRIDLNSPNDEVKRALAKIVRQAREPN